MLPSSSRGVFGLISTGPDQSLVSETNPGGDITNSNLDIASLILHEDALLSSITKAVISAPHYVLDNTPIVSCSTREASTINPVVADLLHTHTLHSRQFFLDPSIFYHPVQSNIMVEKSSFLL